MLGTSDLVAFVPTTDLARAGAFYAEVLGLDVVAETPIALVFTSTRATLRVTLVDQLSPAPYTVLGWTVADIGETVGRLNASGVVFERFPGMEQDEQGIWTTPGGDRVAWFKDPDGNLLSLTGLG